MHFITRIQKILTFMSKTDEFRQQKHTQHALSTQTECEYFNGCIKKKKKKKKKPVTYAKISLKMVNPRDIAGNAEEKKNG